MIIDAPITLPAPVAINAPLTFGYLDPSEGGGAVAWGDVSGKPDTFPPSAHTHDDRYYTEAEIDVKLSGASAYRTLTTMECDFIMGSTQGLFGGLYGQAVGSGGVTNTAAAEADHPGIVIYRSSTTANSGYLIGATVSNGQFILAGSEKFECVFRMDALTSIMARIGFGDGAGVTAYANALYVDVAAGTLTGKAIMGGATTSTASGYTVVPGTWYRVTIELNANATLATFTVRDCVTGAVVFVDTVSTNIPTGPSRRTGIVMMAACTAASPAADIMSVDWYRLSGSRPLAR